MAVRPSLVNLPVFTTTANTLSLPSYLGYISATPTANATYTLPARESYSEGAWTQIKNKSAFEITVNDSSNVLVGVITAHGVGEYVSSPIGWIDYSISIDGVINSNVNITGYLEVGPTMTSLGLTPVAGDLRCIRLGVGAYQQNHSTETGYSAIFGGNVPVDVPVTYNYVLTTNIYNSIPATGNIYFIHNLR